MFSGLKFIPRDELDKAPEAKSDDTRKERKKSERKKGKGREKKRSSRYSCSEDDDLERLGRGSRKKKKWYASDEDLSSYSDEDTNESESESDSVSQNSEKKHDSMKKISKKRHDNSSEVKGRDRSKKMGKKHKKGYPSEDYSSYDSGSGDSNTEGRHYRRGKRRKKKDKKTRSEDDDVDNDFHEDSAGTNSIMRKEMGLDWMLRPKENMNRISTTASDNLPKEAPVEEIKKDNPRELNPYLKNNGSGYPEDSEGNKVGEAQLLSTAVVGDGGASWRLKALKRAKEQASREGKKLEEVVEDRWGSLSELAVPAVSRSVAPVHAHLHAIRNRRKGRVEEGVLKDEHNEGPVEKDMLVRHPKMRKPKPEDSLSWRKQKVQNMTQEEVGLITTAMSSLNRFANDGSFMQEFIGQKDDNMAGPLDSSSTKSEGRSKSERVASEFEKTCKEATTKRSVSSTNQLAAKVLRLRMKGMHDEAEKLLKEAENAKEKQDASDGPRGLQIDGSMSRYIMHDVSMRQTKKEEDVDMHLARRIVQNQRYSVSGQADDEYDYDDGPRRKNRKKGGDTHNNLAEAANCANKILTQQERCQFCFENPTRPKHLVVAIANFTYLSLPQWQPVVDGHCCILTMQHESATRTVDNNVWDEIRNFKKCLIMMFAKQEKDIVFLETVMGLAQQRRHCMVECIPLPRDLAKEAPLYFKKAIDEAEDEWSQHNAKKLIDTSQKGLRSSIPKNFPYFHVEFGLNKGFVHVIDDEKQFKTDFGLNVIRGMLQLPVEDMHRRRKHEAVDRQKQAVTSFLRDWEPFDWTKQLD